MHFCINVSVGLFCLPAPFSSVFPSILDLPLYTNSQEYYGYIWLLLTYNTQKEDRETIKEKEKKKTYSLPSLHERSETPGVLDRRDLESQETPVAQNRPFSFGPHYRLPALWL